MDFRTFSNVDAAETSNGGKAAISEALLIHVARRFFVYAFRSVIAFLAFSILLVLADRWLPIPVTSLMLIRVEDGLISGHAVRLEKRWVSLDDISERLQASVVAAEDIKFFEHDGFDWEAIEKARKHNEHSRRLRGASTISQQVAKNVFLWPGRSWVRKGLEAYFTVLIENLWSKDRIMEVYLNVVEFGDGVYGAEAASRHYFNKSAADLNSSEAALLAAVLPNPRRYLVSHPSPYTRLRQTLIQRRMPVAARTFPDR